MAVKKEIHPIVLVLIFLGALLIFSGLSWFYLVSPVDRGNKEEIKIVIKSGTSTTQIGEILKEKRLIRSTYLFKIYIKLYKVKSLKADTYIFTQDMSLSEIIDSLENGSDNNPDIVKLTFKEGKRIIDYAELISQKTNNTYDEVINVFKDREYTKTLINKYWFLTDKILDSSIYYPLEGYLAPDTYHFDNEEVEIKDIIIKMLDEMEAKLEPYKSQLESDIHYYITMASIVELEGTNTENRKIIVGVFKNRLASGYNLGSDVTTYYGLQASLNKDLKSADFTKENAYNTRTNAMVGKMPIGPICSVGISSIEASINPTPNDYLFFVADKHGNIYYSRTNQEHDRKIAEIKAKGDWIFD